jgi:ParB family chromosome partitioning protein
MKMKVSEVIVTERIRRDSGNLEDLEKSILKYGLLQPILVDSEGRLIAGGRRLQAVKNLKLDFIDVKIVDVKSNKDRLELEIEENFARENFSLEEMERSTEKLKAISGTGIGSVMRNLWDKIITKGR